MSIVRKIPFAVCIAIVLWLLAEWIGSPAPIVLWTSAAILLAVIVLKGAYKAFHDGDKQSLLMWGQFYFVVGFDQTFDTTNERLDKRAFRFEVGFERPEGQE